MQNSDENVIHLSLTAISYLIMVIYRLFSTVATIMCCSPVFKSLLFAKHRFNFEAAIFGKLFMKMFISPLWICLLDFGLIEVFIWSAFNPLWGFKPILIRIPGSVELPTMYFTSPHYWHPCFREITLICFGSKHHGTLVSWEITVSKQWMCCSYFFYWEHDNSDEQIDNTCIIIDTESFSSLVHDISIINNLH